jgi:hypothetical protein
MAPGEGGRLGCLGCCLTHRLDIKRAGESYPDCLREEFASRPIERRGLLYQRARNGHRHPGVTFPAELYPRANNTLVGFVKVGLVECGCDNLLLWI